MAKTKAMPASSKRSGHSRFNQASAVFSLLGAAAMSFLNAVNVPQ
jgi:hypothetical protein